MNKNLIQKFLNQACYDEQDQQELEDWLNVEKFAGLIVEECAEFARQHNMKNADRSYLIHKEMKKHFGVE